MKTYSVTYETRVRGSIGSFGATTVAVQMFDASHCDQDVIRDAFNQIQILKNLETRFHLNCIEVTT